MADQKKPLRKLSLLDGKLTVPFATAPAGGWPPLTGTVRPATPAEVRAYYAARDRAADDPERYTAVQAEFFAAHIATWDFDGAAVTAENVKQLVVPVFSQLNDICLGFIEDVLPNSVGT